MIEGLELDGIMDDLRFIFVGTIDILDNGLFIEFIDSAIDMREAPPAFEFKAD
jgi:hypothetical protein